jgi:DUF971 family protein
MSHEGIHAVPQNQEASESEAKRPLPRIAVTPDKVRVLLTEGKGVEIDWLDGHKSAWSFAWLREACPCATCAGERKLDGRKPGQPKPAAAALLPLYTPPPMPVSAHAVGRYAIQFDWQDGHSGGIYSWDFLRRHCQCRECTFAAEETMGTPN